MRVWLWVGAMGCGPGDTDVPPVEESDKPDPLYPSITQPQPEETGGETEDTGTVPNPTEVTGPAAQARLANLSPSVPQADICLSYDNGVTWIGPWFETVRAGGLGAKEVSAFRDVPAGSATTRVVSGGEARCDQSVPGGNHELPVVFEEGKSYQVSVLGALTPPAGYEFAFIEALGFVDTSTGVPVGAWLRFQHAAVGVTTAWPATTDGITLTDVGISESAYPGMKGYVDVDPFVATNLVMRHDDDVLVQLGPKSLNAGEKITMHLVGGLGLPLEVLWCHDDQPAVDGLTPCDLL